MTPDRRVTLKSSAQIDKMAIAGALVASVLDRLAAEIRPGVTTLQLDAIAEEMIRAAHGVPSFIGVPGRVAPYRHSLCVSLDDEIVHGVPGQRRIRDGQIVSVDAGAIVDGWHGDAARTFIVGEVPDHVRRLVETTERAMNAGIAAAQPGAFLADISAAIEDIGRAAGYGVIRAFVGHGIGTEMHEEPQVTNYRTGSRGRRIEPAQGLDQLLVGGTLGRQHRRHPLLRSHRHCGGESFHQRRNSLFTVAHFGNAEAHARGNRIDDRVVEQ